MPQATKEIQRRIKSISNTKKVTKAMEMVAASKMRKAVNNVLATRSYSNLAWDLVKTLASKTDSKYHPLLKRKKEIKKIGLVLVTSNRGLCSDFNTSIINRVLRYIKENSEAQIELIVLGKKGRDFMYKKGHEIIAEFEKLDITTKVIEIRPENFANDCFLHAALIKNASNYAVFETNTHGDEKTMTVNPIFFDFFLSQFFSPA